MSDGKTILVDVSRCTGCRGCQVACKQWNELPATDTVQTGSAKGGMKTANPTGTSSPTCAATA